MITAQQLQKYIGSQIKRFRKQAGLSQEQLAEQIDIATNSLSSIETGNSFMTITTLEKLLNALDISAKELFDFPETETKEIDKMKIIKESLQKIEGNEEKLTLLYNFIRILV